MRKAKQSTAKNVMILMVDSTDHVTGKTGLTLTITASKDGAAFASISPTVTERGNGWYNVALTSSHTDTLGDLALHITGTAADPADIVLLVEAGATDADVSTRSTYAGGAVASVTGSVGSVVGLTAANLDVAVSSRLATAGYTAPDNATIATIQSDTNDIQSRIPAALVSGRIDASVGAMAADVVTATAIAAGAITSTEAPALANLDAAVSTRLATAGYTAPDNASISAILTDTAEIGVAGAGLTALATQASVNTIDDFLDTEIAAIKAKTDQLTFTVAGQVDANALTGGGGLDAAGVRAAVGLAAANLDTQLGAIDDFLDTEVAAIKVVTDALPDAGALTTIQADIDDIQTRIPAALVGGRMDSNLSAIGNDTTALTAFKRAVLGNIIGTVGAASTTTSIVTSSMTPAAAVMDQFLGRIVVFDKDTTTANLRGQATDITASSAAGVLTVTTLTTAPVSGDTFTIL